MIERVTGRVNISPVFESASRIQPSVVQPKSAGPRNWQSVANPLTHPAHWPSFLFVSHRINTYRLVTFTLAELLTFRLREQFTMHY